MRSYIEEIFDNANDQQRLIEDTVDVMIQINFPNIKRDVLRRWSIGKGAEGGHIGEYRDPDYKAYKMALNPLAGGAVDLTLTGALGDNLTIRKKGKNFEIFSTDEKFTEIGRKYGFEEYGLTEEEEHLFAEDLFDFALQTQLEKVYK